MSLRTALQKAAVSAFNALSDIPESATYRSISGSQPAYNPATGSVTESYTDYTVSFVFTKVKEREINESSVIKSNDMWALIPTMNLTPTPKIIDSIIRDGAGWNIIDIRTDPTEALWKILVRKG
ncbi:MAG: hypothetical protein DRR04_13610 [Gammaproteobacteria bacterium]|nr:MAG: hypothetical protein DRR04_13610 [Gammaproteobacteria bacterium]RLA60106.1 MAG: hypothetical protein DRQ89_13270 [Campylobacterota bacterium]